MNVAENQQYGDCSWKRDLHVTATDPLRKKKK